MDSVGRHTEMNSLATLLFVIVAGLAMVTFEIRLESRRPKDEVWRHRWARRLFNWFVMAETMAVLVGLFMFALALVFHKMPFDWEQMHGFCKRRVPPLIFPAELSLLFAFLGVFPAAASCVLSPRLWRTLAAVAIVVLAYQYQDEFVHWLVD